MLWAAWARLQIVEEGVDIGQQDLDMNARLQKVGELGQWDKVADVSCKFSVSTRFYLAPAVLRPQGAQN